jgi:hypothetical protein
MAKKFYTEKDIEDLVRGGVMSLAVGDDVVLTELAYEKASRLGMRLVRNQPDNPPSAPVRPYLAQKSAPQKPVPCACPPAGETGPDLAKRIREAVLSRMGNQVDPALLDVIIERVLKSTGVK